MIYPPDPESGGTFLWVSDTHFLSNYWNTANYTPNEVAEEISTYQPTAIFITGDLTADGQAIQYAATKDFISRVGTQRYYVLPGNHEYHSEVGAVQYDSHFQRRFSVSRFGIRWIGFCAELREGEMGANVSNDELAWITTELENTTESRIILMGHYPLLDIWAVDSHIVDNNANLMSLITTHSVKAYLSGHLHGNMESSLVSGCLHITGMPLMVSGINKASYAIGVITESSITLTGYGKNYSKEVVIT